MMITVRRMSDGRLRDSAVSCLMSAVMNCCMRVGIRSPSRRKMSMGEVENEDDSGDRDQNSEQAESTEGQG